jgi:Ca2+-binding RTX toxin-like protein
MRTRSLAVAAAAIACMMTFLAPAVADDIPGTDGPDDLTGTADSDTIRAKAGADEVHARRGSDLVYGGADADRLFGQRGADEIRGGDGPDLIDGGRGLDGVLGGAGMDNLYGRGAGLWAGGRGDDRLVIAYPSGDRTHAWCGPGRDRVILNEEDDGIDLRGCERVVVKSAG